MSNAYHFCSLEFFADFHTVKQSGWGVELLPDGFPKDFLIGNTMKKNGWSENDFEFDGWQVSSPVNRQQ